MSEDLGTTDLRGLSDDEFVALIQEAKGKTFSEEAEKLIEALVTATVCARAINQERQRLLSALMEYEEEMGPTKHQYEETINDISSTLRELGLTDYEQYALWYRVIEAQPDLFKADHGSIEDVFIATKRGIDRAHDAADEAHARELIEKPKLVI